MPTALATLVARLQTMLDDESAAVWTTAQLEDHIEAALRDISHWLPQQKKNTLATVSGSRDLDISTLTDRVRVRAVEYPVGNFPHTWVRFSLWADTLTILDDPVPDGSNCYVYWHALHVVNGTKTLPADHDETLLYGAAANACDAKAASTTDTLPTGGPGTERDFAALAAHFRYRYEERRDPRAGLRINRMYRPIEPTATQDTDPGP